MIEYVIVGIIFLIFLLIFLLKYEKNKYINFLKDTNTNILSEYYKQLSNTFSDSIVNEIGIDFMITQGSFENSIIDNVMNGMQSIKNIPTFIFLNNLKTSDVIMYGGFNATLDFPANNITNESDNWIYGGYFIVANNGDFISVKANNEKIRRFNKSDNIINNLKYNDNSLTSNIMYTNIIYNLKEVILINIRMSKPDNALNENYYSIFLNILVYLNINVIKDKNFIISGITGINSKFMDLAIKTVFLDNTISSCYNNSFTNVENDILVQSSFIIIHKDLCPYGVRFGIRYLEISSSNFNFILYATVYNKNIGEYTVNYFDDKLTLDIFKYYQSSDNFIDDYINWDKINIDNLTKEYEINEDTLIDNNNVKYSRTLLENIINK
ncbi:ORF MSV217 SCG gene family protein [Melanoplus sanguinipes entomopoxvirus]|uniref:ORF MSV217 SCG gene family protein n=1 Tax=Melanoplus sanguinipes entomopoxvirus TaxID=83191 RepID=Q9YVM5_MSEPV|nr:ORF MSV217 SCG gene family protein [Melanoplus sanguinipes entomopoxvirus]AAC97748.1 ORF MSV217 SCG gene family protein [Melanoplus sanguinipes entomopoxvirus 'O']